MDTLDTFDSYESQEWNNGSPESGKEVSREQAEKQREKASKALAWIQRTRKDESKGKRHSNLLARILSKILARNTSEEVLPLVLDMLDRQIPTNVIIGMCSIADEEILSLVMEEFHYMDTFPKLVAREGESLTFHAELLTESERQYINTWIGFTFTLLTEEVSTLLTEKFLHQLESDDRIRIVEFLTRALGLFLIKLNIEPTRSVEKYAEFILDQMEKRIRQTYLEDVNTGERVRL